jgi:hypothetical protein
MNWLRIQATNLRSGRQRWQLLLVIMLGVALLAGVHAILPGGQTSFYFRHGAVLATGRGVSFNSDGRSFEYDAGYSVSWHEWRLQLGRQVFILTEQTRERW